MASLIVESLNKDYNLIHENYEIFYSDGVRTIKKLSTIPKALKFAKELTKREGMKEVEIFRATSGFHSTTQDEYLVYWWGDGSYWDNRSKKDNSLLKKKLDV